MPVLHTWIKQEAKQLLVRDTHIRQQWTSDQLNTARTDAMETIRRAEQMFNQWYESMRAANLISQVFQEPFQLLSSVHVAMLTNRKANEQGFCLLHILILECQFDILYLFCECNRFAKLFVIPFFDFFSTTINNYNNNQSDSPQYLSLSFRRPFTLWQLLEVMYGLFVECAHQPETNLSFYFFNRFCNTTTTTTTDLPNITPFCDTIPQDLAKPFDPSIALSVFYHVLFTLPVGQWKPINVMRLLCLQFNNNISSHENAQVTISINKQDRAILQDLIVRHLPPLLFFTPFILPADISRHVLHRICHVMAFFRPITDRVYVPFASALLAMNICSNAENALDINLVRYLLSTMFPTFDDVFAYMSHLNGTNTVPVADSAIGEIMRAISFAYEQYNIHQIQLPWNPYLLSVLTVPLSSHEEYNMNDKTNQQSVESTVLMQWFVSMNACSQLDSSFNFLMERLSWLYNQLQIQGSLFDSSSSSSSSSLLSSTQQHEILRLSFPSNLLTLFLQPSFAFLNQKTIVSNSHATRLFLFPVQSVNDKTVFLLEDFVSEFPLLMEFIRNELVQILHQPQVVVPVRQIVKYFFVDQGVSTIDNNITNHSNTISSILSSSSVCFTSSSSSLTNMHEKKRMYCNLVMHELFQYLGLEAKSRESTIHACEFPLVCSCSLVDTMQDKHTSFLQIHPALFDPTLSLASLPFVDMTSTFRSEWFQKYNPNTIGKGTFGEVLTLPHMIDGVDCVAKFQQITPLPRKKTNSWTAPLVEFEEETGTYATFDFVTEALALFALNKTEEDQGYGFIDGQRYCIPRIFYSTILVFQGKYYSVIVMERLYAIKTMHEQFPKYSDEEKLVLLKRLSDAFDRLESCPLMFHNQDVHGGNILFVENKSTTNNNNGGTYTITSNGLATYSPSSTFDAATNIKMYMLDFGCCMFTLPQSFFCSQLVPARVCFHQNKNKNSGVSNGDGGGGVPIKTFRIMQFTIATDIDPDMVYAMYYNFSVLIVGLLYQYANVYQHNLRKQIQDPLITNVIAFLNQVRYHGEAAQTHFLPRLRVHSAELYDSKQFEKELLSYTVEGVDQGSCATFQSTACSPSQAKVLEQKHSMRLTVPQDMKSPVVDVLQGRVLEHLVKDMKSVLRYFTKNHIAANTVANATTNATTTASELVQQSVPIPFDTTIVNKLIRIVKQMEQFFNNLFEYELPYDNANLPRRIKINKVDVQPPSSEIKSWDVFSEMSKTLWTFTVKFRNQKSFDDADISNSVFVSSLSKIIVFLESFALRADIFDIYYWTIHHSANTSTNDKKILQEEKTENIASCIVL